MRAVVLSDDRVVKFLNENFTNMWVFNADLGRSPSLQDPIAKRRKRESKTFDTTQALAQAIMKGWNEYSPADCLVISSEFELMGSLPVNELLTAQDRAGNYLTFLQDSLAGKTPGVSGGVAKPSSDTDSEDHRNLDSPVTGSLKVTLTDEKPEQQVLNIFRTSKEGFQDYTVVEIDATAFKNGGTLLLNILVGNAESMGSFDLYDAKTELPKTGMPKGALASAWDIRPGKSKTIKYDFEQGQAFKLGATGSWFSEEGSINAFLLRISVETELGKED